MDSSDLHDLIQILDRDPPIVSPPYDPEPYHDPDDIMYNMNYYDDNVYYPSPEAQNLKKERKTGVRNKYWEKGWGKMLLDPALNIPDSRESKQFRQRFRVTFSLFKFIVNLCKRKEVFSTHRSWGVVPLEIKVLIGLRILGRGNVADDIAEMSGVPRSSVSKFFLQFVHGFTKHYMKYFINFPDKEEEISNITNLYAKLGLPGTCGSMDCTHVVWVKCPKNLNHCCKGREKHATVKFQVVCDHTRKILYCSRWYPGAIHDMTVCRNDKFSKWCMEEEGLKDVEYILFDDYGRPRKCKGGHVLVDGGYLKFACFICPQLQRCESSAVYWSELLESVRKDIECVFGILKARFRILKMQLEVKYASTIEAIFQCCCILHNILLVHDGLDTKYNDEAFWSHLSPENDNEEESTDIENIIEEHQSTQHCLYVKTCKLSFCNSATNAISSRTSEDAIQNVKLVVNPRSRTASLKVIRKIRAHEEIFTDYNSDYTYGPVQDIHLTGDSIDLLIT